MQLCDSCGACRESEWRVCPFCRAALVPAVGDTPDASTNFDALAAVAEGSESELLPSPIETGDTDTTEPDDLITAEDLAHLTGAVGPEANAWESAAPPTAPSSNDDEDDEDESVPVPLVLSLAAVAVAAVLFVGYSIVTASPSARPDSVALVDPTTTTTAAPTTTETTLPAPGFGPIGVDLAEQISNVCSGAQFGIARAEPATAAIHNDLVLSKKDGPGAWETATDQITLRADVPSIIGCLTTFDGGEIDRCPDTPNRISRRSVAWTYRVLQASDGTELGADSGTATEVRDCAELVEAAAGADYASFALLPWDRLDTVATEYTTAPHPSVACPSATLSATASSETTPPVTADNEGELPPLDRPAIHASPENFTAIDLELPPGWAPSADRPVEVVVCVSQMPLDTEPSDTVSQCVVTATARHRDGRDLGSWSLDAAPCNDDQVFSIPLSWWTDVVGPALGYPLDAEAPADESAPATDTGATATDDAATDSTATDSTSAESTATGEDQSSESGQ